MDKNKLEWHDLYKPVFLIRLEDIDPARHYLLMECWLGCGHIEIIDVPARIAEKGRLESIRDIGRYGRCPKCGSRKERDFSVLMREGVQRRSLEEVRPNERRPISSAPSR